MLYALALFAQAVEDGKKAVEDAKKDEGPGALVNFMPIILIVIVFYFLIFLPGRKEKQQRQSMISALKKNDKVITSGGVIKAWWSTSRKGRRRSPSAAKIPGCSYSGAASPGSLRNRKKNRPPQKPDRRCRF